MSKQNGSTVDFAIRRIPLDVDYECPVSASTVDVDTPLVTILAFHKTISGSAEEGSLISAPPSYFEVRLEDESSGHWQAADALQAVSESLALDEDEMADILYMLTFTTPKKHTKIDHLTAFKLNQRHWEWRRETQGEIGVTRNTGDGLLVHATVWNATTLNVMSRASACAFEDDAMDPFDEDEFAGVRHRSPIPQERQ